MNNFDQAAYERERQAARAAYLQKKAALRQATAQAVVNEKVEEMKRGITPASLQEADLLVQRSRAAQIAKGLVSAAQAQARSTDTETETASTRSARAGFYPEGMDDLAELTVTHESQKTGEGSNRLHQYVHLADEEIEQRIASHEFTVQKTLEELQEEAVREMQDKQDKLLKQRQSLPIYRVRGEMLELIRKHSVIVVVGETGSGKTTQLLQYMYEDGMHVRRNESTTTTTTTTVADPPLLDSSPTAAAAAAALGDTSAAKTEHKGIVEEEGELRLICTQPRRIAAVSVAKRVAEEMGCRCGGVVGYKVRFDDKSGPHTKILYVTDGIMLKEFVNDPDMEKTAAIMIDEAHERSLNSDILLGLLRDVVRRNPKLRIIVASATINAEKFSAFFDGAPVFNVTGRTFPVEMYYAEEPVPDYITEAAQTTMGIHLTKPIPGDILIFLPGQDSIEACVEALRQYAEEEGAAMRPMVILPVFSSLPPEEQARIYQPTPPGMRKVVVATNIAETSITIDGVVYVIDCGLCKQNYYNPKAMTEELRVVPISQASALQRAGRAGRTQPGECFRLYTPYTFRNELPPDTIPEILRCSMSAVVLQLKVLGIDNLLQFDFLDPPSTASLEIALDQLFLLGAMKADGKLTVTGRRMAEFPLDPSWSKALIRSSKLGCARHMAMAAAMLTLDSIFVNSRDAREKQKIEGAKDVFFASGNGDLVGYVNLMEGWLRASGGGAGEFCRSYALHRGAMNKARDVLDQLLSTMDRIGLNLESSAGTEPSPSLLPVVDSLPATLARAASSVVNAELLTKALLSGFFYNVARLESDRRTYTLVRPIESALPNPLDEEDESGIDSATAEIHPSSYLFRAGLHKDGAGRGVTPSQSGGGVPPVLRERPSLVVFTSLRHTTKRYMVHVTSIMSPDWVLECAPENYFEREMLEDSTRKRPRE